MCLCRFAVKANTNSELLTEVTEDERTALADMSLDELVDAFKKVKRIRVRKPQSQAQSTT